MYYWLKMNDEYALTAFLKEENPGHDLKWLKGQIVSDIQEESASIICEEEDPHYADYFEVLKAAIVSEKFLKCMSEVGVNNFQFLPIKLIDGKGRITKGHYLFNVIGNVECLDRDNSVFSQKKSGKVVSIKSLKINPDKTRGEKIFRLKEKPSITIVDEVVFNKIHGMAGIMLEEAETNGIRLD